MNELFLPKINLDVTLLGGQSFAWQKIDGDYYGVMEDQVIHLMQDGDKLLWQTYPTPNELDFINDYFRVGTNYDIVLDAILKDQNVYKAYKEVGNVRLLKQPFEQTLLSFLVSSNNSVKAIKTRLNRFSKLANRKAIVNGHTFDFFPKMAEIQGFSTEALLSSGLGYRAKYVKAATHSRVRPKIGESEVIMREKLLQMHGIGDKIADCVMIFGLGFDDLFPLDRWGRRILTDLYGHHPKMPYKDLREWVKTQYNGYASWASQLLFEWYRR